MENKDLVNIIKINCEDMKTSTRICRDFEVKGFPQLVYLDGKTAYEFNSESGT